MPGKRVLTHKQSEQRSFVQRKVSTCACTTEAFWILHCTQRLTERHIAYSSCSWCKTLTLCYLLRRPDSWKAAIRGPLLSKYKHTQVSYEVNALQKECKYKSPRLMRAEKDYSWSRCSCNTALCHNNKLTAESQLRDVPEETLHRCSQAASTGGD